jgi:hypothetical protein
MFLGSLSDTPDDDPRPPWVGRSISARQHQRSIDARRRRGVGTLITGVGMAAGVAPAIARLLPDGMRLLRAGMAPPFSAARTPTMAQQISPARSFAVFDLPLGEVKRIGQELGATVNDVVLSVCDEAMHRYLRETGESGTTRLVAAMAVSTRRRDEESASNAVTVTLLGLGAADAAPVERVAEIAVATGRIKSELRRVSSLPLQLQLLSVFTAAELRERLPVARGVVPLLANFTMSNISGGPERALYLGRARLTGFYIAPIAPPAQSVNFTLLCCGDTLCVGIGAARNILPDTERLAQFATASFQALQAGARAVSSV